MKMERMKGGREKEKDKDGRDENKKRKEHSGGVWTGKKKNDSPGLGLLRGNVQFEIFHIHGTVWELGKAEVRAPSQSLPTPRQLGEKWHQSRSRHAK